MGEKKYSANLSIVISVDGVEGAEANFMDADLKYSNLSYEDVCAIEGVMMKAADSLNNMGIEKGKEKKVKRVK